MPLESRNAKGYIIAFDNTNGTASVIALNALSTGQVYVTVTVRDDKGAVIATETIVLSAYGNYAFTLGTDRYSGRSATRNHRVRYSRGRSDRRPGNSHPSHQRAYLYDTAGIGEIAFRAANADLGSPKFSLADQVFDIPLVLCADILHYVDALGGERTDSL